MMSESINSLRRLSHSSYELKEHFERANGIVCEANAILLMTIIKIICLFVMQSIIILLRLNLRASIASGHE